MIFANPTAAAIWKENWCDRCCQPDQSVQRLTGRGRGCPILYSAMVRATPPKELTKGRNGSLMADAFRCDSFADKPTSTRPRTVEIADEPSLFGDDLFAPVLMDADHQ